MQITRKLAWRLRTVFRRALELGNSMPGPPVVLRSGPDGLSIRVHGPGAAIEHHTPGSHPRQEIIVPFEFLDDCHGRKEEPITLTAEGKDQIVAQWRDGSIPQVIQYPRPSLEKQFPKLPRKMQANDARLLTALQNAQLCCDASNPRYALGCIQLRACGDVAATDGRQLLVESGFCFPWQDEPMVRGTKLFGCRELLQEGPVEVGRTHKWLTLRHGCWTIHLAVEEGRFPKVDEVLSQKARATSRFTVSAADAEFLLANLKQMPAAEEQYKPVTIDLNGQAVIRAKAEDQPKPTELILQGSTASGKATRRTTDRTFLTQALKLGFRQFGFYDGQDQVLCEAAHRRYVWMLLGETEPEKPSRDAIRIPSPGQQSPTTRPTPSPKPQRRQTMPRTNSNANGRVKATPTNESPENLEGLIQEAEALKSLLRETAVKTNSLLAGLKRQRKQNRLVSTTLQSLRQLQQVAG